MFRSAHELVIEAKKSVRELSPDEVEHEITNQDYLIIDVREPGEFQLGHIPEALNIPRGLLEFRISSDPALQDLDRPIMVYCKTSGRAALSVVALQSMGFRSVISMAGGFDAWSAEGREIAKPGNVAFD